MAIVIHEIKGHFYAYEHTREGDKVVTRYLYPTNEAGDKKEFTYKVKQQDTFEPVKGKRKTYLKPKRELVVRVWHKKGEKSTVYHNFESQEEADKLIRNQKGRSYRVKTYWRNTKN